jgi:hypothetical protein
MLILLEKNMDNHWMGMFIPMRLFYLIFPAAWRVVRFAAGKVTNAHAAAVAWASFADEPLYFTWRFPR